VRGEERLRKPRGELVAIWQHQSIDALSKARNQLLTIAVIGWLRRTEIWLENRLSSIVGV
jgi:hypothetical protein